MITIRCKDCNTEIIGHPTRLKSCGCSNMATVRGDKISAVDLTRVIMLTPLKDLQQKTSIFSAEELAYQESRRKRKIKKLDFEIR
jgi:hypothetical protein